MLEEKELKAIVHMLKATTDTAEHMRMVDGQDQRSAAGVRQYNAVLKHLKDTATIPEHLFMPLDEDSSLIDFGMCCDQLTGYLEGMLEVPAEDGKSDAHSVNAPYINISGGTPDLDKLGELIRQAMPSWIREQMEKEESEEQERQEEQEGDMNDLESKIAELGAQMQVLAERMHREELSADEIRKLADQMRGLGQQQSELAKKHAIVRARED